MPSGSEPPATAAEAAVVSVERLTMAFGERVLQQDISFRVRPGSVFVVMGGSGSGKSTLLRHLVGLQTPAAGAVYYGGGELLRRPAGAPGRHPRQLRGHVPAGCALELDDARRERGAAAAGAGPPAAARRARAGPAQARAGRARRLRRLLPGRDQRRDA